MAMTTGKICGVSAAGADMVVPLTSWHSMKKTSQTRKRVCGQREQEQHTHLDG